MPKVLFVTVVPSPYQRDLFFALNERSEIELSVWYLERGVPENPWPEKPLSNFERVLPGFGLSLGEARAHVNWKIPGISEFDVIVLSTFTSAVGQLLMRGGLRGKRWLFWGERLHRNTGLKGLIQGWLAAPMSGASGIVGIGRAAQKDYQRRFPRTPQFCIPYHCDMKGFLQTPRDEKAGNETRFLFCGQMILRKGVDLLLLAFDRLVATHQKVELVLIGREAKLPKFLELVSTAAKSKIRYEGFQDLEHLPGYFAKSDVFVLPSRHDGWGVVVNQALAAGLPIITSDAVGAGLDLVENGVNGLHVAAGDLESLYNAMNFAATNPTDIRQWGIKSRERALSLTPEAGAERWISVLNSLPLSVR